MLPTYLRHLWQGRFATAAEKVRNAKAARKELRLFESNPTYVHADDGGAAPQKGPSKQMLQRLVKALGGKVRQRAMGQQSSG